MRHFLSIFVVFLPFSVLADDYDISLSWQHDGLTVSGDAASVGQWGMAISHPGGDAIVSQSINDPGGSLRTWQLDTISVGSGSDVAVSVSDTAPETYLWGSLAVGASVYVDRPYTYEVVPPTYLGFDVLRTANSDKDQSGDVISFVIDKAATIYVAHDSRISPKPAWMAGWADTGDELITDDTTLVIFSQEFPAGTVTLGENGGAGMSMYAVLLDTQSGAVLEYGQEYNLSLSAVGNDSNVSAPSLSTIEFIDLDSPTSPGSVTIDVTGPSDVDYKVIINGMEQ